MPNFLVKILHIFAHHIQMSKDRATKQFAKFREALHSMFYTIFMVMGSLMCKPSLRLSNTFEGTWSMSLFMVMVDMDMVPAIIL